MNPVFDPSEYWDNRAKKYGEHSVGYLDSAYFRYEEGLRRRAFYKFVVIRPGMRILEVGCGTGNWSFALAKQGAEVTGTDISGELIKIAKNRLRGETCSATFLKCPAEALHYKNEFDFVFSITALQHVVDRTKFCMSVSNMVRAARPGAQILILEKAPLKKSMRDREYLVYRTREDYVTAFNEAGAVLAQEMPIPTCLKIVCEKLAIVRNESAPLASSEEISSMPSFLTKAVLLDAAKRAILMMTYPFDCSLHRILYVRNLFPLRILLFKKSR